MLETTRGFISWDDAHHPQLSRTNGEIDGRWAFINGNNTSRIVRINLKTFRTDEILEIPNNAGNHASAFIRQQWLGLKIQADCEKNTVKLNNFIGNTFDVTTNGKTVLNTFTRNYWDKYEGYDLNRDQLGDVPYHPVSLFGMIVEKMPFGLILLRSFMVGLLDRAEKVIPTLIPENFVDTHPSIKPIAL